jgi:hypothetical protein
METRIIAKQLKVSQSDPKWMEVRTPIGGSDSDTVCGVSDKVSVLTLAQKIIDKRNGLWIEETAIDSNRIKEAEDFYENGLPPLTNINFYYWLGHQREPLGKELLILLLKNKISVDEGYIWVPTNPEWSGKMHVSPDGMIKDLSGQVQKYLRVLEVKSHANKLPDRIPLKHVLQICHTFLVLENLEIVDYIGVAYDVSTLAKYKAEVVNEISYVQIRRPSRMIKWYRAVVIEFYKQIENGFKFRDNKYWVDYITKLFGPAPLTDFWSNASKFERDSKIAPLIKELTKRETKMTMTQIREYFDISNSVDFGLDFDNYVEINSTENEIPELESQ